MIEKCCKLADGSSARGAFSSLHNAIDEGKYHMAADLVDEFTEETDLVYREQLNALKARYERLERAHRQEIEALKRKHEEEMADIRRQMQKNNRRLPFINNDPYLMSVEDIVEVAKERFSRSAADELTNLLYKLSFRYHYENSGFTRMIDNLVPAVMERESPHHTIEIPAAHQVNINPQLVTNQFDDKK